MNWGKGIAIVMTTFIVFIVVLVVILMRQSVDLESADYYSKEINYQDEITAMNNAGELDHKIQLIKKDDHIVVQVPEDLKFEKVSIQMSRPNNQDLDKTYEFGDTKTFLINKEDLAAGMYNVQISFNGNGKNYLQKETIYI
jgi:hypothetical protein